jgi:CRP-like cAMP-binding protein
MENLDLLFKHLSLKVDISQEDLNKFVTLTKTLQLKKGDFFLREGRVARYQAFLLSGVMASYSTDKKGEKHVIQISIEGHWTSDLLSFLTREPSKFNIEALEDAKLMVISKENFELACKEIPIFERFYRILIQNAFVQLQRRISNIYGESAEVRYLKLISEKPEIVQSVPQHYLASYLGIKPQSLSRIRKNIVKHAR